MLLRWPRRTATNRVSRSPMVAHLNASCDEPNPIALLLRELEVQAEVSGIEQAFDVLDKIPVGVASDAPRPQE